MPDDTEAAALFARLEAIVKKAEDSEAQAAAARCRVQATRLLLEESKAAALEQTATAARQRVPSSSSPTVASQLVPTASSTYEDMVVVGTLKIGYPCIQALSQDKEQNVHPHAAKQAGTSDHTSLRRWAPEPPRVPRSQTSPY
jgi:hypothetical protein